MTCRLVCALLLTTFVVVTVLVPTPASTFRIRKFHEMTGLGYETLDAMTFLEASDQLSIAAADESSIMDNLEVKYHTYFITITDAIRKVADPQDTCTYSGSTSSKE